MDTTELAVICRMFLIEVESCSKFCVRGTIKLISLVTGAMLLEDRDASIITRSVFISLCKGRRAYVYLYRVRLCDILTMMFQ